MWLEYEFFRVGNMIQTIDHTQHWIPAYDDEEDNAMNIGDGCR